MHRENCNFIVIFEWMVENSQIFQTDANSRSWNWRMELSLKYQRSVWIRLWILIDRSMYQIKKSANKYICAYTVKKILITIILRIVNLILFFEFCEFVHLCWWRRKQTKSYNIILLFQFHLYCKIKLWLSNDRSSSTK